MSIRNELAGSKKNSPNGGSSLELPKQTSQRQSKMSGDAEFGNLDFWEHTIEEDGDFDNHFDYVHWNPVKHGYVSCPKDWPHSSFHRHVKAGVYPIDWGCSSVPRAANAPANIKAIKDAGEP